MFLDRDRDDSMAIFDIASASIGGALVKHRGNAPPEISYCSRKTVDFPRGEKPSFPKSAVVSAIDSIKEHFKKNNGKFNSVLCVFSAPWYVSQARIVRVKRGRPFEVDEKLLDKLLDDEVDIFKREWSASLRRDTDDKAILLEKERAKVVLNGYEVSEPFGKKVSRLELYMYLSLGPAFFRKALADYFSDFIENDKLFFRTFPFVLFNVLKRVMDTKEGMVFVDVGGEITDVFVIRENVIEEVNSFSMGDNFFVKKLAKGLGLSFVEAQHRLAQYQRMEIGGVLESRIKSIIEPAIKIWEDSFKKLLVSMTEGKFLPSKLYLCGPFSFLRELEDIFKGPDFNNFTIFGKPFEFGKLSSDSFKYHFESKPGFPVNDIYLILSALFADSFLSK